MHQLLVLSSSSGLKLRKSLELEERKIKLQEDLSNKTVKDYINLHTTTVLQISVMQPIAFTF